MMAALEQTTTPLATEWTYRSDADRWRGRCAVARSVMVLLSDEAIAGIAEANPDMVRDHRRAIGSAAVGELA